MAEYSLAGSLVDGRIVLNDILNIESIGGSLDDYEILPGIRKVPLSDFDLTGRHWSVEGNKKIKRLVSEISSSNKISPLIIVIDAEISGRPYILEGEHRIEALYKLKAKFFPALVVLDYDSFEDAFDRKDSLSAKIIDDYGIEIPKS